MKLTLYAANCSGNKKNSRYPNRCEIDNPTDFLEVVSRDHVCAEYRNNHRSNDDFIRADGTMMDNDNSHSDDPKDWIWPKDYETIFGDVKYVLVPSRNNMKEKDGKAARPRHHIYFPHDEIDDFEEYRALKESIEKAYPFFDSNAIDAARFFFGAKADEIVWHEGGKSITDVVGDSGAYTTTAVPAPIGVIPQGCRNRTMSRFAGRVVKRYGPSDRAHEIFINESTKCDPPLEDEELDAIWGSACRFAEKVQSQDGYVPPEKYEFETVSLKPSDYSDIGQAKVITKEYGNELKYTIATDYLRYDGVVWRESKQQAVGAVEEFLDLQLADAIDEVTRTKRALLDSGISDQAVHAGGKTLEKMIPPDSWQIYTEYQNAKAYLAFVMKRRDMKYVTSAMQAAKPMLELSPSDLDRDGFLLNTPSGTYDLREGVSGLHEHRADDYITKITQFSPGDEGKDIWLSALDTIFQGDTDLIDYVQQTVGLCAIGNVYREEMIISYGDGRNGKSTFWNTIASALGSYSGNISADTLTVGCRRNVKPELAEAKGKRLLIASELEEGMRLNTATIKQLCSTDEMFAEKKYKDPFSFKPSHTLVLYTNHLPRVGAIDDGIWRRLIVIPFKAKITGKKDIKNYTEYLLEHAGPYVIKWIIDGARKVVENDFTPNRPQCVTDAMEKYKKDSDWLRHYIDECCEVGEGLEAPSGEFYETYRAYCMRMGEFARSTTEFYTAVELAGFKRVRKRHTMWIYGLKLIK